MSERPPLPGEHNKSIEKAPLQKAELARAPLPLLPQRLIHRQFLLDTLQEKRILIPFTVSAMGFLYLLLYAPQLGGVIAVGLTTILTGLWCAGALLWRVVIGYRQGYIRKLQQMTVMLETQSALRLAAQLRQAEFRLAQGFESLHLKERLDILGQLEHEYRQLQPVINRQAEEDQLSSIHLAALISEAYGQGLNVLEHVLDLESAMGENNERHLLEDIRRLEQKAAAISQDWNSQDTVSNESFNLLQEKIAYNKERLNREKKLRLRVEELMYQAEHCKTTLSETRIELAVMKADASDNRVTSVIDTLQKTIERAKEVQAELKDMGY